MEAPVVRFSVSSNEGEFRTCSLRRISLEGISRGWDPILKACRLSLRIERSRDGPPGLYMIRQNPPIRSWSFAMAIIVGFPRDADRMMKGLLVSCRSVAAKTGEGSSFRIMISP